MGLKPAGLAAVCLFAVLALTGCNRSVSALDTRLPPEPLPSTPLEPVAGSDLAPLGVDGQPTQLQAGQQPQPSLPLDPTLGDPNAAGTQIASLEQPGAGTGEPITREGMAGTWTVATDNPDCRIILAFTKWSGGYRAATRRCNTPELASVSAWDVKDNRVILVDANGNTVANLSSTGVERYDGSTSGGKQISFTR